MIYNWDISLLSEKSLCEQIEELTEGRYYLKDKVIDLMAKKLYKHGFFVIEPVKRYDVESELYIKSKTKEEIKNIFIRK